MQQAQGLSVNVIIIAAIVLLLLVAVSVVVLCSDNYDCWEYTEEVCINQPGVLCLTDMDDFERCYTQRICLNETKTTCGEFYEPLEE